ncbi:MAG: ferrous iron transport protein A [Mollicutes bacterium]|nr:ferrous iron transport protein A [Mollicutes bacterium]
MEDIFPLSKLEINEKGIVKKINIEGEFRRRLLDLGLIPDTEVTVLQKSPFGDPVAYLIRGAVIALRREIVDKILVERVLV